MDIPYSVFLKISQNLLLGTLPNAFLFRSMLDTSSCGVFPCFLEDHLKSEYEVHGSMVWFAPMLLFNEFFFNKFSEAIL